MNYLWKQISFQTLKYSIRLQYTKSLKRSLCYNGTLLIPIISCHNFHNSVLVKINQSCLKIPYSWSIFFQSTTAGLSCWNCASINNISSKFCLKCKKILPIDKRLNYFEIFELEQCYEISKSNLTASFRKLQSIFHPDKFSILSEKEQNLAAEHSSILNKAYSTLIHPVERAEYLLMLFGLSIEEHEVELTMEPDFLMQIMEINEALVDAEDKGVINEIARKNKDIMAELKRDANSAFSSRTLSEAKKIVAKMKYYNNIYEKIREFELKFGIVH